MKPVDHVATEALPAIPLPMPSVRRSSADPQDVPAMLRHAQLFLIMKVTRLCNLRCSYCNAWREGPNQIMPMDMVVRATEQALALPWVRRLDFVWHGGETTLLPIEYFREVIAIQERCRGHRLVVNSIQTNGTRLDDDWVDLFKQGRFLVGVSLDPPAERHARTRKTKGGRDSWAATLEGMRRLREASIEHGALIVVTPELVEYGAERFLECLNENDITTVALLNVLPDNDAPVDGADDYLGWDRYVQFLIDVYLARMRNGHDRIKIREIDSLAENVSGRRPTICIYTGNCMGQYLTVEPSGEVAACDKYIGEKPFVYGSLASSDLSTILSGRALSSVREDYFEHRSPLEACSYYGYCNGGCPHDQYLRRKVHPTQPLACCGLRPLIDVIRSQGQGAQPA